MAADQERLRRTLSPQSVVVVGDKAPNYQWLGNQNEYSGRLYSVQINPTDVAEIEKRGFQNFASILDVPDEIDLVICAVPRPIAPKIIADAAEKGVGGVTMFTSGFAETGEPEAIKLQEMIVATANAAGMPLVGPNCMGIYNRRLGLRFSPMQQQGDDGNVSVIAQSGTHAMGLSLGLQRLGIKVSRAISMGNAAVLNEADYLEFLRDDDETDTIVMYLEGAKEGRRFYKMLREVTKTKPVVIWRGGRTEAGARAVASHTGSLASSLTIWEAMARQAGAIPTASIDETLDVTAALVHTNRPSGRGIALIAMTGGQSVAIADQFSTRGFDVPSLSEQSYKQFAEFFNVIGGSYRNPFDAASTIGRESDNLQKILDILKSDDAIDGGIAIELGAGGPNRDLKRAGVMIDLLDAYRQETGQPVVVLVLEGGATGGTAEVIAETRTKVAERGFAVYPSFERGAIALGRVVDCYANRDG